MSNLNNRYVNEGFYFGISDEFNKLALSGIVLTSKNMTLDHAFPKIINKNGLKQKMSAIWNDNGKGWKSRYGEVGIKMVMNPDP